MGVKNHMESLLSYSNAWLIYLVASLIGWWCWYKLFFWLKIIPFAQHLAIAAGAVLVFTPAPVSFGSDLYAPAFIVTAFSVFSDGVSAASHTYFYWTLAALIAVASLLVIYSFMLLYKVLRPKKKKQEKQESTPKNDQQEKLPPQNSKTKRRKKRRK